MSKCCYIIVKFKSLGMVIIFVVIMNVKIIDTSFIARGNLT